MDYGIEAVYICLLVFEYRSNRGESFDLKVYKHKQGFVIVLEFRVLLVC